VNRNKTARQKNFATVLRSDIPRSKFRMRQTRKQAFNAAELVPIMCEEVLPGDVWQHRESVMARLATPIAPVVDDLDLETFYFFVPNRIVWPNWEGFITGNNTALVVPTIAPYNVPTTNGTLLPNSVFDQFGLLPQTYAPALFVNALPIFGYFTIFNQWFRDQNLQDEWTWDPTWVADGSEQIEQSSTAWDQMPVRINKRHDYFTSSLPFAQKGAPVTMHSALQHRSSRTGPCRFSAITSVKTALSIRASGQTSKPRRRSLRRVHSRSPQTPACRSICRLPQPQLSTASVLR